MHPGARFTSAEVGDLADNVSMASNEAYGSAADIPSIAEMLQQIEGGKLLTKLVARGQRRRFVEIETQVRHHVEVIDRFYRALGTRNWIVHEDLPMTLLEELMGVEADDAERRLIAYYQEPDTLQGLTRRLVHPALRVRAPLVDRAKSEFLAGRFNTSVSLLLSVMDGFVNDVDALRRRGLHARAADEMVAWNSVVGHHMGLAHAHASFTKAFKKTSTEEVRDLYRHGIVHGMLVNYDNEYVGAKAWNRLFAVRDWATAMQRKSAPPKVSRSWTETLRRIDHNRRAREALDAWTPSEMAAGDEGFDTDEAVVASRAYLDAWSGVNYGSMASLLGRLVSEATLSKTAGAVREAFEGETLEGYELTRVRHTAAAVTIVETTLRVGGEEVAAALRWIRAGDDGMAVAPNEAGRWGLMSWTKWGMVQEARARTK
jgi:hypothetical protein